MDAAQLEPRSKSSSPSNCTSSDAEASTFTFKTKGSKGTVRGIPKYRTGKWTDEETKFASQIIRCYGAGILKLPHNTTLRSYLSQHLECDPMRVTKKFPGTATLMREMSEDEKPDPPQSAVQQALVHLKSLEDAFRERLQKDRQKQESRPSVFSLLADTNTEEKKQFQTPASADLVQPMQQQPQQQAQVMMMSNAAPLPPFQHLQQQQQGILLHNTGATVQTINNSQTTGTNNWHNNNNVNTATTAMQNNTATATTTMGTTLYTGDHTQQQQQQMAAALVTSESIGLLLSSATPGTPLAVALATPFILAQLWKVQEQQEDKLRAQRATLLQLSPPNYAAPAGIRAITPINNNHNHTTTVAPAAALAMQHNPALFMGSTAAPLQHSQSVPNMMFTPQQQQQMTPMAAPPTALGAAAAPNPMFLNFVNSMCSAAPAALNAAPVSSNNGNTTTTSTGNTAMAAATTTLQQQQQQQAIPGWLANMTTQMRNV